MGNNCCSAFRSSVNEIAVHLGFLEELVRDLTFLDQLIAIIDQRLQAIAGENERAQESTSTREAGSSCTFDSCLNFGRDLVMTMSKRAERNCCMVCVKSDYNHGTRKVVYEVLKGVSLIQLLAAGVCVVGYLSDQIFRYRDQCIQLLRSLCALARYTKQLEHRLPAERQSLNKAVNLIFDGCALCLSQMESHRLFRHFQTSVDVGDFQKLESQIRNTYADLTLGAFHNPRQDIVGREIAKDRVIELLKMDPTDNSKRAVVIYGFGGIGKTTLASAVFNAFDLEGYKFCRLDMDANMTIDGIKQLQEQMLTDLFGRNIALRDYEEGQWALTNAFRGEGARIFMFIDNALEENSLAKLLPTDLSCLPSGIRILVTTRKLDQTHMLSRPDFERIPFELDVLSFSDSTKLLFKIALGSANASLPPDIASRDVEELVNMCVGIPLLLQLLARKFNEYLFRASELESLKVFLKVAVERILDQVYNSLDELSQEALLDIVSFLDKCSVRVISAAVGKAQLQVLLDAALVKLSFDDYVEKFCSIMWGTEEETPVFFLQNRNVKVHDIVKASERWLSQQRQDRILETESLNEALRDTQKLQKIKGIGISPFHSNDFEFAAESLNSTHSSLRVLKLPNSIEVNGICQRNFDSLTYLMIDQNLPMHSNQLKRLTVLAGPHGACSENLHKLPASLQVVSLKNSPNLPTLLQSFGNLSSLEYLDLEGCDALVELPTSFGQLQSLIQLDLRRCVTTHSPLTRIN